jgi:hypothetical protein
MKSVSISALEAFGNISHNRYRRPLNRVRKAPILREIPRFGSPDKSLWLTQVLFAKRLNLQTAQPTPTPSPSAKPSADVSTLSP